MPYIEQRKRDDFDPHLREIAPCLYNGGDLNYCFTKLCLDYIAINEESYAHYADCIAALEGAKMELYRRFVAPYEDIKIKENGDVKNG